MTLTATKSRAGDVLPRDVHQRFERAVEGAHNPVAAVRALRRVAAHLPARYQGQRDAVRWAAELALRPFFRELKGDRAAKAAVWAALDGIWERRSAAPVERSRPQAAEEAAARLREAMCR